MGNIININNNDNNNNNNWEEIWELAEETEEWGLNMEGEINEWRFMRINPKTKERQLL